MTKWEFKEWAAIIHPIVKGVCQQFPDTEYQDLAQELWLTLFELQAKGKLLTVNDPHSKSALLYAAKKISAKNRRDALVVSPQYAYRTKDIRYLFEHYYCPEDWMGVQVPKDAKGVEPVDVNPVQLEVMGDISRAYDKLPTNYKALLYRKYVLREELNNSERYTLSVIFGRMAEILNTYPGITSGNGRRKAITNEQARMLISMSGDQSVRGEWRDKRRTGI